MDIKCPQCDLTFVADPTVDDRYTCTSCAVSLFVKQEPGFQPIAALAFPAQSTPSVPLKSFFTIAPAHVPDGLMESPDGPGPSALARSSLSAVEKEGEHGAGDLSGSTLDQPPPPLPQSDTAMLDDEVEMTSIAGGSFAAALTPAPLNESPHSESELSESRLSTLPLGASGMAPPPWEKDPSSENPPAPESWAVGPPALPPRAPPPLTKKPKTADDFARALGLPDISIQEPERPMRSAVSPSAKAASTGEVKASEDDETEVKPQSRRATYVVAIVAVVLVGGGILAALRVPSEGVSVQPSGASAPKEPGGASTTVAEAASGPSGPSDPKTAQANADKRAKVIDHYNLGNKHYLQRKYPQAVDEFRLALELDPTFALAHRGMGVTYAKQGKAEQAIKEYKAYLKLAPDAKDASQVQKVIKEFEQ